MRRRGNVVLTGVAVCVLVSAWLIACRQSVLDEGLRGTWIVSSVNPGLKAVASDSSSDFSHALGRLEQLQYGLHYEFGADSTVIIRTGAGAQMAKGTYSIAPDGTSLTLNAIGGTDKMYSVRFRNADSLLIMERDAGSEGHGLGFHREKH